MVGAPQMTPNDRVICIPTPFAPLPHATRYTLASFMLLANAPCFAPNQMALHATPIPYGWGAKQDTPPLSLMGVPYG